MTRPLGPVPEVPALDGRIPHELDLAGMAAGSYFTIDGHTFMAAQMNLNTRSSVPKLHGEQPVRDIDEIDLRLVHAWWKCPND